ncbi:MAG TPA: YqeG family HAD IIIA-type phosphatase [Actinobacteria bacterium]|nr:YqeG family HAD IIIA-type phosphatase [Actinomycetes bacterium]HEX21099.1 YqeG family HAD IIIA-type phosphatase [Actinomycetota bacterium]
MFWQKLKAKLRQPFIPTWFAASIFKIDYQALKNSGLLFLLYDLDNTLVARDDGQVSDELKVLFSQLKDDGFKIIIISNNWGHRVRSFGANAGVPVFGRAAKPMGWVYKRAMAKMGARRGQTVAIGDQIFTDVFGANRLGLKTILVNPVSQVDLVHTKILRRLERLIIKR